MTVHQNQFELLIRTKERRSFVRFFKETHKGKTNESFFIPLSTYIFSRQMSNLQVSIAKKYNYENERRGTLFASRFERFLLESQEALDECMSGFKNRMPFYSNGGNWLKKLRGNEFAVLSPISYETTDAENFGVYTSIALVPGTIKKTDLGGYSDGSMKIDHLDTFFRKMMIDFRIKYPCGPNYN